MEHDGVTHSTQSMQSNATLDMSDACNEDGGACTHKHSVLPTSMHGV